MIKRLIFASGLAGSGGTAAGLSVAGHAPPGDGPRRAVTCVALADLVVDPIHAAVRIEWFADMEHLGRYERWLDGAGWKPDKDVVVIVAEEHVLRGDDWLAARWADGGPRYKHMALARRAQGLTQAQFSERWQSRAGRVGATPIPEEAKGCAYAQDHPVPRRDGDCRYDAVNEVWFDDVDALRTRIAWMDEALRTNGGEDDLVSESSFLALREECVVDG